MFKDGEVGGSAMCHVCPGKTFLVITKVAPFSTEEGRLPMYDNAVLGCGTCCFDCRFCIGLFPSNVKVADFELLLEWS